jgi:hypothetical protein
MKLTTIRFSGHAVNQMFRRQISVEQVHAAIDHGEIVDSYPDDHPFPSYLILGLVGGISIHVVLGVDETTSTGIVITAYHPDPELWSPDFRTRRKE